MVYESTITFTLDTICPWTYIGFLRLQKALSSYRAANPSSAATFTLRIAPYQLYPEFSQEGVDRHTWYREEKYAGSEERYEKYAAYMGALGRDEGVELDFSKGSIANTFHAHRVLQHIQTRYGADAALAALTSLYEQYFVNSLHPASAHTLRAACRAAGLSEDEASELVRDEELAARETTGAIREQVGNGVDSVPYVVFEGRKRDFTLVGAKEVGEYVKTLGQVAKEAA